MPSRPISWVNTPVLVEAMQRYEQGLLPRSMQLWLQQLLEIELELELVLELEQPLNRSLRSHQSRPHHERPRR